jgi:hypothetical protein
MSFEPALPRPQPAASRDALAEVMAGWWRVSRPSGRLSERAQDFARLRRLGQEAQAAQALDVARTLLIPSVRALCGRLTPLDCDVAGWTEVWGGSVATAAIALAHVDHATAGRMADALRRRGATPADARILEPRVRSLLGAGSHAALLRHSLQLLRMLHGVAPAGDLGAALLLWLHEPSVRLNWAEAYYGLQDARPPGSALPAAPGPR